MSFKTSGLHNHQRQSLDIRCKIEHLQFDDSDCDTGMRENTEIEVDPAGDLFGDYQDYIQEEFGSDCLGSNVSDDESEDALDEEGFILTDDSETLEPERLLSFETLLSCPLPDDLNSDETDSTTIEKALRRRGGAEEVLQKRPFVLKFTKGRAGAIYDNQHVDGDNLNASYTQKVGNAENPYSPFSSKLEWEIAHWVKMRGPSSTAFNELMKIEGVSIISCQLEVAHTN
jgi:hypothetical protein